MTINRGGHSSESDATASAAVVRAVLDDPPIRIRPNLPAHAGAKEKNPLGSSHSGTFIISPKVFAHQQILLTSCRELVRKGLIAFDSRARASTPSYKGSLWSYATAQGGGMRAVARQVTKGVLLLLRPYSRPVGVAPRQRQNQAKHNPIKYDAARFCLLSHQHRVYASDFDLLGERLREASGAG